MKYIVFDCDGTLLDTSAPPYHFYPGVKELLGDLAQDCLLYVWTARGRTSTLRILQENGVSHLFEAAFTPDDGPTKPHIMGLEEMVGVYPKSSICVIGDTTNDILGAKNFGIMSIGAIWNGESDAGVLKDAGADFIATHPAECSKLIRQNLKGEEHV